MADGKGIFIRGFGQSLTHEDLTTFFEAFGDIKEVILNKMQKYAIVEFQERASADIVLSREMFLHGKRLKIVSRKPKFSRTKGTKRTKANVNQPANSVSSTSAAEDESLEDILCKNISLNNFDSQILKFVKEVEAIDIERKVDVLCRSLEKSMSVHFPGCKIHPFGSSITGLASKESDVDIFVDLGSEKSTKGKYSPSRLVMMTKGILLKSFEFTKCIPIPKARVPILKCFHKSTKLNCDINFQSAHGIFNSLLIKFYITLEPQLRTLIMLIKYWAKSNHLSGPGNLTSYALFILVLHYIQQLPNVNLPTVEALQKKCTHHRIVQGWDCNFDGNPQNFIHSMNKISLIKLLGGFFNFYANFEFAETVVISNFGASVPKCHFSNTPKDSLCFRYKKLLQKVESDPIEFNRVMCVLDPFVLNHNITANVGLREMNKLQIQCFKSAELCHKIENGDNSLTLNTIVGPQHQQKKTKFPYLEIWKDQDVRLIIPLNSFNPENSFETSKFEVSGLTKARLIELLICQLKEIFEKVFHFSLVKEDRSEDHSNMHQRQIAKAEGMEDVHSDNATKMLHEVTLHLSGCFHVWNGRGNAYKEFSFPNDMKLMEREMHITNYIVDTFYKGTAQKLHKVDLRCIFVPIMDFRCLEVQITSWNHSDTFKPMINFLLILLHKWLHK